MVHRWPLQANPEPKCTETTKGKNFGEYGTVFQAEVFTILQITTKTKKWKFDSSQKPKQLESDLDNQGKLLVSRNVSMHCSTQAQRSRGKRTNRFTQRLGGYEKGQVEIEVNRRM